MQCADSLPIVLGEETMAGVYASWSCNHPSEWSSAELQVVDAIPSIADTRLKNETAVKGSAVLVSRGVVSFVNKAKRASAAGAAAVILFKDESEEDDEMFEYSEDGEDHEEDDEDEEFISDIPVLMIKSSDVTRLRKHGHARLRWTPGRSISEKVEPKYGCIQRRNLTCHQLSQE